MALAPVIKYVHNYFFYIYSNFMISYSLVNSLYIGVGRHTLVPSIALLGLQIPIYIVYFLLYNRFSSKYLHKVDSKDHRPSTTTVSTHVSDEGQDEPENASSSVFQVHEICDNLETNPQVISKTIEMIVSDLPASDGCDIDDKL